MIDPDITFHIEEIPATDRPKGSSLRYRIVARQNGELMRRADGRPFVVVGSLRPHSFQLDDRCRELNECAHCREQELYGKAGPSHKPSVMCEIKTPHCRCIQCASGGQS